MVPKMMYVQQHTTTRSVKKQPTKLVDLDELDHIIRLTHGAMTSRHRSIWLDDDVIWSAMARSPWTSQLYLWWSEKLYGDLDKAVCSARNMREEGQQSAGDHCRSEPLSIDAVRRFIVYFMAWGWTDSYRSSHLKLLPVTRSSR